MKKFIIAPDVLKPALKKLGMAVNEKALLPITKNMLCKVGSNEIEFVTTDTEMTIAYKCVCETGPSEPFDLLIPFKFFYDIVMLNINEPVSVELVNDKKAKIICAEDVYELKGIEPVALFPKIEAIPKKAALTLDDVFVDLLHVAMFTTSSSDTYPATMRACLDLMKEKSRLVSTDANMMFTHFINCNAAVEEQIHFSKRMAKAMEGMKQLELSWNSRTVCMQNDELTVWCRRYDDRYPNYKSVIPAYTPTLEINKVNIENALNKALIVGNIAQQTTIHLQKEKGYIHFESIDDYKVRKINSRVEANYTGTVEKIALNAKKLLTILSQIEGEVIRLHIHDASKAVLISTPENEDYLGLIMPLLPNNE